MSFLHPLLLLALPLIALPVIIHLINQRRYQTVRWGAMMFLLAANRMSRGYARIRQWLILAARMLAIAGLIFAISRPLSSGVLGWTGGARSDATIVILDRSPSMQANAPGVVDSKLATGRRQLAQSLETLGTSRLVLIDSATAKPRELASVEQLVTAADLGPTDATADLPELLAAAQQVVEVNQLGRADIWICSDLRQNDWQADSRRWQALRSDFQKLPQAVRFHLLAYAERSDRNLSVRVTQVRRNESSAGAELLLTIEVLRDTPADEVLEFPLLIEIEGSRSQIMVQLSGDRVELRDHRIPLDRLQQSGWGRVSLPADANLADNDYYFVFDQPLPRQTLIVSDNLDEIRPIQLAASISPEPNLTNSVETVTRSQFPTVDTGQTSLIVWHGPLPDASSATTIRAYVARGGVILFMPPRASDSTELFGMKWDGWRESPTPLTVTQWRADQDLLANTLSGSSLPVGDLAVQGFASLAGVATPLASLGPAGPLFARVDTEMVGSVYFCTTLPNPQASNLATNGVVLYAFIQRAISRGNESLGNTRELVAGNLSSLNAKVVDVPADQPAEGSAAGWLRVAGDEAVLSSEYAYHSGIYRAQDRMLAVNRSVAEDHSAILEAEQVRGLFAGLDFVRIDDQAGSLQAIVQEVWRVFLFAMIAAMIGEAALCLPRAKPAGQS